jgi:hypothetical protein
MGVFSQDGSALEWRGGHEIVPLERIPVYVREGGAIEPFGGFG